MYPCAKFYLVLRILDIGTKFVQKTVQEGGVMGGVGIKMNLESNLYLARKM